MKTVDVCVVGAGPAGCFAAFHLARVGYEVLVLEEHSVIGEPVDCSGVIGVEAFSSLGLPRSSQLDELRRIEVVAPSGATSVFDPQDVLAYLVDRAAFDRSLASLAEEAGARIERNSPVVELRVTREGVTLGVKRSGATVEQFARAVVLASGPRYRFQEQLGMGRPSRYLATMQGEVAVERPGVPKVFFGQSIAPGSFAWFLPVSHGHQHRAKIGVSSTRHDKVQGAFQRFVMRLGELGLLSQNGVTAKGWMIPIKPLPRTFSERVVAVGDAAGQTKPTTGGGLYYGLQCAQLAAETVEEGLRRGDLSARHLSNYERRWKGLLGSELRAALIFRRLIERLSDRDLDRLFGVVMSDGFSRLIARKAKFDWHRDVILGVSSKPRFAIALAHGVVRSWLLA